MYLAIDVGGTKTLLAVFTDKGEIKEKIKFPTPKTYDDFLKELASTVANLSTNDFKAAAIAIPGVIDRKEGIIMSLGNLDWGQEHIARDLERLIKAPVIVENDAKLAGLSEAVNLGKDYTKVLYVTISTGIGIALINDGIIDDAIGDTGGHDMYVEFGGKRITWEKLASGKTIYEEYGKKASEIDDPAIWKLISKKIAVGLIDLIALLQPNIIVIGGGVGTHFAKYENELIKALRSYETPMTNLPKLISASNPEEAVIYGCYELSRSRFARNR